jgi:SsrA-binding protein
LTHRPEDRSICINRRAWHEFFIDDTYECGIVLVGTEVKSLRAGLANLSDAYVRIDGGEAWLFNCHISPFEKGNRFNHDPIRTRKLLLHRREIAVLQAKTQEKGLTLVPLRLYFEKGKAKLEIGVGRGKKLYDKRESLKEKESKRDIERALRRRDD